MRKLFDSIDEINRRGLRNVGVMFSTGRDSCVMLDLFISRAKKAVGHVVFLYLCPGLQFQERLLKYYEHRYKIEIVRQVNPDAQTLVNTRKSPGRQLRMADAEARIRGSLGQEWIAFGYRKVESLMRRGQCSLAKKGIEERYRKLFPIADWNAHHVREYVKKQKLVLPSEYQHGWRDIPTFKGTALLYIHNNYPDDYERIVAMYPDVRGELIRVIEEQKRGVYGKY